MYFQILLITKRSLTNIYYVLPVASDLAKSFPSITLFNPLSHPVKEVLLFSPFYLGGV